MKRLALSTLLLIAGMGEAEVLDRIAVTVGKTVITEGEVVTNLKVAAFLDQKEPDLSGISKRNAADRLVDQVLLRREVLPSASAQDTSVVIADLKKRYGSEVEYQAALARYGITEQDVVDQLNSGLESVDASNRRFRGEAQVTEDQIRSRYETFAKNLREKNAAGIPSFEASRAQLQELLIDERVSDALDRWLAMMRDQTSILYREAVFK